MWGMQWVRPLTSNVRTSHESQKYTFERSNVRTNWGFVRTYLYSYELVPTRIGTCYLQILTLTECTKFLVASVDYDQCTSGKPAR